MRPGWLVLGCLLSSGIARAAAPVTVGQARLDPPTTTALGVQLLISDDDNHNAVVGMSYRRTGDSAWTPAMDLWRVHPEVVVGRTVPEQFAGSVWGLKPGTAYELALHITDVDGPVDQRLTVMGTTRAVPAWEPASPRAVAVSTAQQLTTALAQAQAGDVITLANGTYAGNFAIQASGTALNPIVLRGLSTEGVILDGQGCTGCNVLEVYGSFVHVERLTLAHASRAFRFQGVGAQGNVLRRVHITDVTNAVGSKEDQKDFYVCDNVMEGRLSWPKVYTDDNGIHANDDGIELEGTGHVVCHNHLVGFGDGMKLGQPGARGVDFVGNDVLSAYDNALEFDTAEGNVRALNNRFTNSYAPISFQPIYGGPVYAVGNVVVNVADEQLKLHGLGTLQEPSGILVLHNTFVSPRRAWQCSTVATTRYLRVSNNLFVGPGTLVDGRTVNLDTPVEPAVLDINPNGYFPDGTFRFGYGANGSTYPNFAAVHFGGTYEGGGRLLTAPIFQSGLVAPPSYLTQVLPPDATLASTSTAVDTALAIPGLGRPVMGAGPDLGALERGCPLPTWGVRPEGVDENTPAAACGAAEMDAGMAVDAAVVPSGDAGVPIQEADGGAPSSSGGSGGGCHCGQRGTGAGALAWLLALAWVFRRSAFRRA